MDIVRVLPWASGNKKLLIAATNYFTKWVEAEPLTQIREVDMMKFIRNNILYQFGILLAFVMNNKTQFSCQKVKKLLDELKIEF